jgi:hypothetical protein
MPMPTSVPLNSTVKPTLGHLNFSAKPISVPLNSTALPILSILNLMVLRNSFPLDSMAMLILLTPFSTAMLNSFQQFLTAIPTSGNLILIESLALRIQRSKMRFLKILYLPRIAKFFSRDWNMISCLLGGIIYTALIMMILFIYY